MGQPGILLWISCLAAFTAVAHAANASTSIGVNWGTMLSHPLLPSNVVTMLKANGISKVKLFDADSWTVNALHGSDIEVMVAIPNDQLERMNEYGNAKDWVKENITSHNGKVDIKYVAVGNEPFLESYNGSFTKLTYPALKNVQKALNEAGVGDKIKATVPLNADVYNSPSNNPVPSSGNFRSDIRQLMLDIVKFLHSSNAPFIVNIYPFLSLYQQENFPLDFAFFDGGGRAINDGGKHYTNVFDANFDTLVWSLKKAGVPNMKIIVGEVGWPTDGDVHANRKLARRFYDGFLKKMAKGDGTPMRPDTELDAYLFGLIDEDTKSILPGNFERHWGIFTYDGKPKFPMDLSGQGHDKFLIPVKGIEYLPAQWCVFNQEAKELKDLGPSIAYACTMGDCTALGYGSSCNDLDINGNTSYAFNMYFQMQDQDVRACDFGGLAIITTKNASRDGCLFPVQIMSGAVQIRSSEFLIMLLGMVAMMAFML